MLAGWPDIAMTAVLVSIGSFLILVGVFANRVVKLPVTVWAIL
jgi:hypothetical protein